MASEHPRLTDRRIVLALLLCIALLNYGDRYLVPGLAEPIRTEFKLSDSYMGLLLGPAFALVYSVLAIPVARLADRASRILIICVGCALWSGFTALSGLATEPWMLVLARIGVGVGEAGYQAPTAALIAAYFPLEQRGRAFALIGTSIYFGQMLGYAGGPALAAAYGWRAAFQTIGAFGIATALAALILIREPPRPKVQTTSPAARRQPLLPLLAALWKTPSFRNMTLAMGLGSLSGVTFGMWGPALLERTFDISTREASSTFGMAFGIPGLIGTLGFGYLADRLARKSALWPLRLSAAALFTATATISVVAWAPSFGIAKAFAIPSGLLGGGWSIGVLSGLQVVLPERHRATGTAFALLAISLMGNVAGPAIAGYLSDALSDFSDNSLRLSLSFLIPTGFIGAWLMLRASRTLESDQARLADQAAGGFGEPGMPM